MDAKAYKGWPGLVFNSCAHHGPAPWRGERYAIVFYNGCNTDYLPDESIEELLANGFRPWGQWGAPYTTGIRSYTSEYTAVNLSVYGRIYTGSIRLTVCTESCMLCPFFRWATGPHMPGTCFCSNYSYNYVYECPSEGEGALFGEYSRIL